MQTSYLANQKRSFLALLLSTTVAAVMLLIVTGTLFADPNAADLTQSSKSVSAPTAALGDTVTYTITLRNTGGTNAQGVVVTDTLPAGLQYVANSLDTTGVAGSIVDGGESGGVITITADVGANITVPVTFQTIITAPFTISDTVTNMAEFSLANVTFTRTATSTVVSPTTTSSGLIVYLPILFTPVPAPSGLEASRPVPASTANTYKWTLSWANAGTGVTYMIDESNDSDFSTILNTYNAGSSTSYEVTNTPTWKNTYYYQIRAIVNGNSSAAHGPVKVVGPYFDGFDDEASGWGLVREDTDDTENETWYRSDGHFVVKVRGRWDYQIASSKAEAPAPPYRIETNVRLHDPDNLNGWGFIFGADLDETMMCPNEDFTSCFNHYYRSIVIWRGSTEMPMSVKKITYHTSDNNSGKGDELIAWGDIRVSDEDGFNKWAVEVYPNGDILFFWDDDLVRQTNDTEYINDPYFGLFASSDEYLGSEPWFDYLSVLPLP